MFVQPLHIYVVKKSYIYYIKSNTRANARVKIKYILNGKDLVQF